MKFTDLTNKIKKLMTGRTLKYLGGALGILGGGLFTYYLTQGKTVQEAKDNTIGTIKSLPSAVTGKKEDKKKEGIGTKVKVNVAYYRSPVNFILAALTGGACFLWVFPEVVKRTGSLSAGFLASVAIVAVVWYGLDWLLPRQKLDDGTSQWYNPFSWHMFRSGEPKALSWPSFLYSWGEWFAKWGTLLGGVCLFGYVLFSDAKTLYTMIKAPKDANDSNFTTV